MAPLEELLERIYESPEGTGVLACFDYDGTLIGGYSAAVFYEHRLRSLELGPLELARTVLLSVRGIRTAADFEALLELSLGAWRGRSVAELDALGERLFRGAIAARLHVEAWELLDAHRQMGHTLVLASSATSIQVDPMAREMQADYVLCTPIEIVDGKIDSASRIVGADVLPEVR